MQYRSGKEIRQLFVSFWESKGCHHYKSFSLVPDDPSLLFTIAGMVPFKKYYLGLEEPEYARAVTSQKCVRTNDIENVGRTARHHTFFEMLGNFSWGGYFKRESLTWGWEFLTQVLGLDGSRMYATIYKDDREAFDIWTKEIGMPESHLVLNGEDENFWFMGPQGPCGPDSEILYDQGKEFSCGPDCHPGCDCDRFLEIWNHVFTQYDRQADGSFKPLPRKNIDTGMGLERLASLIQGVRNDFETDLFAPLMKKAGDIAGVRYGENDQSDLALKVISDHVRAVCFMIADGILPANDGQGYVLRRLIRRAARYGRLIGIDRPFINDVIPAVIELMGDPYAELGENRLTIEKIVEIEENGFGKTIRQGSELLDAEVKAALESAGKTLGGAVAFQLYDTFGFPLELTREICAERGVSVDEEGFKTEMARQRERARSSSKQIANNVIKGNVFNALANEFGATDFVGYEKSECNTRIRALVRDGRKVDALGEGEEGMVLLESSPFYAERGGQIGDTGLIKADGVLAVVKDSTHPFGELNMQTVTVTKGTLHVGQGVLAQIDMDRHLAIARNHTATHILHAVLGKVLGGHVRQNGSLVSDRFLRFDYTHYEAPRREQLEEIETLTNAAILADRPVTTVVTDLEAAKASGAKALFEEKYGQTVRVVSVGDFSSELCGGTHVPSSGTIGSLKIVGEESIGSGIRRITAVTGMTTVRLLQELSRTADELSARLAVKRPLLIEKVKGMEEEIKALKRQIDEMSRAELAGSIDGLIAKKTLAGGAVNLYIGRVDGQDMDLLRESGDKFKDGDPKAVFVIFSKAAEDKVQILCMLGEEAQKKKLHAGRIVKELAALVGGSGGGRPNMAQAGGREPGKIDEAIAAAVDIVAKFIGA